MDKIMLARICNETREERGGKIKGLKRKERERNGRKWKGKKGKQAREREGKEWKRRGEKQTKGERERDGKGETSSGISVPLFPYTPLL